MIYIGSEVGYQAVVKTTSNAVHVTHVQANPQALVSEIKDADGLIDASMKVRIDEEILHNAKKLKIIACATTGADHIERPAAERRNITIRTLREDQDLLWNLTPAAEHSWCLLMACVRKLPGAFHHVQTGQWVREQFPGVMLRGKQIGIIGCGRIGNWMGRYANAFEMKVVGCDPYKNDLPAFIKKVSIDELVATSDFISIHVHLTDETHGLLSERLFRSMKPNAVVVNTSRGAIVDEAALLKALVDGRIGGAGLDVLDGEPDIEGHPLVEYAKTHDNLIITPHCGGFSPECVELVCARSAQKILEHLER